MKKTEKFSRELKGTSYGRLIDEFGKVGRALDKIGILIYEKPEDRFGGHNEWQEKYFFPSNVVVTIDGEFKKISSGGEMTPARWSGIISLQIEYFLNSNPETLNKIEELAKRHSLK